MNLEFRLKLLCFLFCFLCSIFLILSFDFKVYAHLIGQPPYFKIDGVYTALYPVPTTSLEDFNLPQDIAPKNYLVGEEINFEMDISQLPATKEIINQTEFTWHYGDGKDSNGLKNTHKYLKPGSFIFTMDASYGGSEPQFLQSVLINILPQKNYQLPTVKVIANEKESKDPLTDVLKADFRDPVTFEARTNRSDIKEYIWDFGDGKQGSGKKVVHQYESGLNQIFPVVKITTNDGFITHDYLQINNEKGVKLKTMISNHNSSAKFRPMLIGFILLITVSICVVIYRVIKRRKSHNALPPV